MSSVQPLGGNYGNLQPRSANTENVTEEELVFGPDPNDPNSVVNVAIPGNAQRGDKLVYDQKNGLKTFLGVSGGVLGMAGLAGLAYSFTQKAKIMGGGSRMMPIMAGIAALTGAGLLLGRAAVDPKTVDVTASGLPNRETAARFAHDLDAASGILHHNNGYAVVQFPDSEDLDNVNLTGLKVGDGSLKFDGLVTRDGDLLLPTGDRGYRNSGVAVPPIKIDDLSPDEFGSIYGTQIGTADNHSELQLGSPVGDRNGYTSVTKASEDLHSQGIRQSAIIQIGDKYFAFQVNGPNVEAVQARGTELAPLGLISLLNHKSLLRAERPGESFDWYQRGVPFSVDEPVGRRVNIPHGGGTSNSVVGEHLGGFDNRYEAINNALNPTRVNELLWAPYPYTTGYAVIRGETGEGPYQLYSLNRSGGSSSSVWNQQMGRVESVVFRDFDNHDTYVSTYRYGDYIYRDYHRYQRTNVMVSDTDDGQARTVATSDWRYTGVHTTRTYSPDRTHDGDWGHYPDDTNWSTYDPARPAPTLPSDPDPSNDDTDWDPDGTPYNGGSSPVPNDPYVPTEPSVPYNPSNPYNPDNPTDW